jgi:hypothetical protein
VFIFVKQVGDRRVLHRTPILARHHAEVLPRSWPVLASLTRFHSHVRDKRSALCPPAKRW